MRKKIFAISGSTKANSSNERLLKFMSKHYANELDIEVFTDLESLPHFNPDKTTDPEKVIINFRSSIENADGVIICTPEYVFSLPGSLKNALEWTVSTTIFSSKSVAIIVASASGEKAFESLELIMKTIEARIKNDSKLLINGIKGKFNEYGKLDQNIVVELDLLMSSLISCIEDPNKLASKFQEV